MDGGSRDYDWLGPELESKLLEVESKSNYSPRFSQANIFLFWQDRRFHGACYFSGHSVEGVAPVHRNRQLRQESSRPHFEHYVKTNLGFVVLHTFVMATLCLLWRLTPTLHMSGIKRLGLLVYRTPRPFYGRYVEISIKHTSLCYFDGKKSIAFGLTTVQFKPTYLCMLPFQETIDIYTEPCILTVSI